MVQSNQQSTSNPVNVNEGSNLKASTNVATIAFLGKTGAGKTTLMNAMAQKTLG